MNNVFLYFENLCRYKIVYSEESDNPKGSEETVNYHGYTGYRTFSEVKDAMEAFGVTIFYY